MADTDVLDRLISYLDSLQALADHREVPAYTETCPCGGSIEVGKAMPAAERRRVWGSFIQRHRACVPGGVGLEGGDPT